MKKFTLSVFAFLPVILFAGGNQLSSSKPQKQISNAQPAASYVSIRGNAGNAVTSASPFNPIPFLTPKVGATGLENAEMYRDPETGMPIMIDYIDYKGSISNDRAAEKAADVMQQLKAVTGIQNAAEEFRVMTTETDHLGMTHVKLQQTFKGLDVFATQAWVHFLPNGKVRFNGRTEITPTNLSTQPVINETTARAITATDVRQSATFTEFTTAFEDQWKIKQFESSLVVLPVKNQFGKFALAWHVTVRPNFMYRYEYFVDAVTGAIRNKFNNTTDAGAATAQATDLNGATQTINTFQDGNYYLINSTKAMYTGNNTNKPGPGKGIVVTLDAQNTGTANLNYVELTSSNNAWNNPKAVSAHTLANLSFDYFKNTHNRNSINGQGGDVVSFINVTDNGQQMDNAFWNGQYMFYGNGVTQFKPLAGGLDVGGHEMTHGVIQATAALVYQDEPGALNESFADVFGAMIDRADWQCGEDVVQISAFPTGVMRDMANPHNGGTSLADNGYQPAHVSEKYTGTSDNGGVHINSGIPNHACYIIGTALGKGPTELIYYRALSNYLTANSKFIDCRLAVVKATEDLHGVGSSQSTTAQNAFTTVGIGSGTGTNPNPTIPNNTGANRLLLLSLDNTDQNTIYLTDDATANFTPISTTPVNKKPSVTDDGSYALFVGTNNNIYNIQLTSPYTQNQMTTDGFWDNVAVSKDGRRMAATSRFADTSIYVYDFTLQQWARYYLYNPTTGQGINGGGVLYADALDWSLTGDYLMYDSYNKFNGTGGQVLDYWDVGFIKAWGGTNFGDGTIFKVFSQLPENVSVGNPAFAKNSLAVITMDYVAANGQNDIIAANIEKSETGLIFANNGVLGFPCYNPQDNKIAFNSIDQSSNPVLAFIDLDASKLNGNVATAAIRVNFGGYAQWNSTGTRNLPSDVIDLTEMQVKLYPNPVADELTLILPENFGNGTIAIFNLMGELVSTTPVSANTVKQQISASALSSGTYIVRVNSGTKNVTTRFVKM